MELPVYIPYLNAIYLIIGIGIALIIFTAIGALFNLWSWKAVQSMAYAFLAIVVVFIIISYFIGQLGIG